VRPGEVSGLVKSGAGVMLVGYGHTLPGVKTTAGTKHHGVSTVGEVGTHELHVIGAGAPQKCHGDSGGPTLGDLDATGGYDFRVIGVTSRADEFCSAGSIETRVDAHLDWIHSVGGSAIPCGSGKNPDCPAPPKKGLGDPCDRHDECEGALCVPLEEGSVCSQRCALQQAGACPAGFNCVPIVGASDGACVAAPPPPKKKLLEGCTLGEECEAGLCGFMRGERFCTVSCDPQTGGACPEAAIELVCIRAENGPHACVPRQLTEIEEESGCSCGGRPAGATGLMLLLAVSFLLQSIYPGRRC
jgi:hypothetical protein